MYPRRILNVLLPQRLYLDIYGPTTIIENTEISFGDLGILATYVSPGIGLVRMLDLH